MQVGSGVPLIIARGIDSYPLVWLSGRASPAGFKLAPVVSASISVHPLFRVDRLNNQLTIYVGPQKILHVSSSVDEAVVDFVDLNLLGFAVKGDDKALEAGGVKFSDNSFYGISAMLNLAPPQKQQAPKKKRLK